MKDFEDTINNTLYKLIDLYEAEGKTLMLAWQTSETLEDNQMKTRGNFMSTSATVEERGLAILEWASQAHKSIDCDFKEL